MLARISAASLSRSSRAASSFLKAEARAQSTRYGLAKHSPLLLSKREARYPTPVVVSSPTSFLRARIRHVVAKSAWRRQAVQPDDVSSAPSSSVRNHG